ncbi:hypothetical protein Ami103574_03060 [Aminipila butyrica]|uniref:Lipoprotein n=1 Tax=Aminipila butyrica TaxID=433296 RepID=A0A858BTD2_9FIRM|nr:hypothetical protein [Aminipila butyrica]QIB68355.1 hypothetical protein Ami103574_03060 [Aminipila butyrica]
MKKIALSILLITLLLTMTACGKKEEDIQASGDSMSQQTSSEAAAADTSSAGSSPDSSTTGLKTRYDNSLTSNPTDIRNIEDTMKSVILSVSSSIQIDSLTVMDADLAAEGGYKVYAILTWKDTYSPADSRQFLQTYSSSIAGAADGKLGSLENLSLVWLVPNLNGSASLVYDKTDGLLDLREETFDQSFGTLSEPEDSLANESN